MVRTERAAWRGVFARTLMRYWMRERHEVSVCGRDGCRLGAAKLGDVPIQRSSRCRVKGAAAIKSDEYGDARVGVSLNVCFPPTRSCKRISRERPPLRKTAVHMRAFARRLRAHSRNSARSRGFPKADVRLKDAHTPPAGLPWFDAEPTEGGNAQIADLPTRCDERAKSTLSGISWRTLDTEGMRT